MVNKAKQKAAQHLAVMAYKSIQEHPEEGLPKLLKLFDVLDTKDSYKAGRDFVRQILADPSNPWYHYLLSIWEDLDSEVRYAFFQSFFLNSVLKGREEQRLLREEHQCNLPWAILVDPTTSCNLSCTGCWAAEYEKGIYLSYETLDALVKEGKSLGTYMYLFSGGEPLMRKRDIIALCEAHPDCYFLAFTNGTLIDEAFASEMLRVKNFAVAISIEGDEAATDARRGAGTYAKAINAMAILKRNKLLYGISCCYTSQNVETIGSEAFIDSMVDMGAKFAWFFTYIPIGKDAVPSLMVSAEQRAFMYRQVRAFRKTKPIFTMDFWNDGEFVNGCIAGGRCYLHINAQGDIEPCAFVHYSDSNIYTSSLLEAYKRPLFQQYKEQQPFNQNLLRPCPLLDNPERLRQMVHASGAISTDLASPEPVDELTGRCEQASKNWAVLAEQLWEPHAKS